MSRSPGKAHHGQQGADGPVVEAGGGLPARGASYWPPGLWPGCAPLPLWLLDLSPSPLTGGEGPGCTMRGSAGPAPGQTPPLRVNSALVKVSPLLRLFFPLNPTGEAGNLVGRRPGVWGELGTLGLCDLDASHPTPELRCQDRVTSPSASRASGEFWLTRGSCHPSILQGSWAPSSAWQGAPHLLSAPWSERAPDAR